MAEARMSRSAAGGLGGFLRAAFAHATWQLVLIAALLGAVRVIIIMVGQLLYGDSGPLEELHRLAPAEVTAACMLMAVLVAEQRVRNGASRFTAYVPAVTIAALVAGLIGALLIFVMSSFDVPMVHQYQKFGLLATVLYCSSDALARGGLAAFVYANREHFLTSIRQLRAAELQRAQTERDLASSRLLAVRAMIQPEALIATLKDVQSLYARDRAAADVKLADFIEHLRSVTLATRA
jgi:hypothetical protein